MKVLVQLRPWVDGVRMDGRKAWITSSKDGIAADTIYTTESTAKSLSDNDMIEVKRLENNGAINIISIIQ